MRLEPYYPEWVAIVAAGNHLQLGEYEQANAINAALFASEKDTAYTRLIPLAGMAVAAVFQGDIEGGREYIRKLLELKPNSNVKHFQHRLRYEKDKAFWGRYFDALRQAGLPENPPS